MLLDPIEVGPFDLHACVGTGGMGQVWRGLHRAQRVPVAVKVIRAPQAVSRRFTLAFRNEVRQVAKLDHPNVVRILDYGEIDAAIEARSNGRFQAGSPYFAMEYASGGSLADHPDALDWPTLRAALFALLAGLGHAHARGVLHRDLSPRNILFSGPDDPRPGLKLADFGLARGEMAPDGIADGGTPQYMPPEQFESRIRDQGPWSDLYGLGCVAWELATGAAPFVGRTARDFQRLHASAPVPPLVARVDLPADLESWLLRLLQKDPRDRFRFAADAAAALERLGPPELRDADTAEIPSTIEHSGPLVGEVPPLEPAPSVVPEVPRTWRVGPDRAQRLVGVGLGLYELRTLPLVDRVESGDRLWATLGEVWTTRRPRLVLLRGQTGHGKTHLARWVAWRAQELVGAELLTVEHSPFFDPTHGLKSMVASVLGCVGLGAEEGIAQLDRFLASRRIRDPYARSALVRYLTGDEPMTPGEQDALVTQVLGWLCADRPLVLRLEELQWGEDTVRFARSLLGTAGDLPVLMIATSDAEGDPQLVGRADVSEIEIGPLQSSDQLVLVRELLSLDGTLAERVVHRTSGSPLFAERLVGEWVRREALEVTPSGFALRPGTPEELPDSLHQVWIREIEGLLDGQRSTARIALHVGCALGMETDRQDWIDACARLGIADSAVVDELADALCAHRLAEPRDGAISGWLFTHPLVWESLRRDAVDAGDWERVNAACAAMLADRPSSHRLQERLGLHLLAAGQLEASLAPLLAGARRSLDLGELSAAGALLDRRDGVMTELATPAADPRWGEGRISRVRLLGNRGDFVQGQALSSALAEDARRYGWRAILPEALRYLGLCQLKLGRLLESEAMFTLAQMTASQSDDLAARNTVARCALSRGTISRIRGSLDEALEALNTSQSHFEGLGDRVGVADARAEIGAAWLTLTQRLDLAEGAIGEALALYEQLGNQVGIATCVNTLGDTHRRRGDLDAAEAAYRRAQTEFDRLGSDSRLFPRLNLGVVLLAKGQVAEADAAFAEAQDLIERSGRGGMLGTVRICRLPGLVLRRDWEAWDAVVDGAERPRADADLAWVLDLAASAAREAGEPRRADGAAARAAEIRSKLG